MKERGYALITRIENIGIDALRLRNLGSMMNHSSSHFNAENISFFHKGAELSFTIATKRIPKGMQVLVDYSENYWKEEEEEEEGGDEEGQRESAENPQPTKSRATSESTGAIEMGGDPVGVFPTWLPLLMS
jgi:SET domain-containing protein